MNPPVKCTCETCVWLWAHTRSCYTLKIVLHFLKRHRSAFTRMVFFVH